MKTSELKVQITNQDKLKQLRVKPIVIEFSHSIFVVKGQQNRLTTVAVLLCSLTSKLMPCTLFAG